MEDWDRIKVGQNRKETLYDKCGYAPSFRTSSDGYQYCNLHNAKGQGDRLTCWAAAVATTVNYRLGTNYTDEDVWLKVNRTEGPAEFKYCTIAANKYGLSYKTVSKLPEYALIRSQVKKKWPVMLHGTCGSVQHAVTAYGYREVGKRSYLMLWDSAGKEGSGGVSIVIYTGSVVCFNTNSYFFDVDGASYHSTISYK